MPVTKPPAKHGLGEYQRKRDFQSTPEPAGGRHTPRRKPASRGLAYCVQKHQATTLHYDFGLEHDGVLLSWAVPKGPSLNPADKRLAIRTEDHPLEYGGFEGVIPEGYGAGVVMLWDRGSWAPEPQSADVAAALRRGELKFSLSGRKLKGSWVLVRTRGRPAYGGGREQWLLIKHQDRWAQESALPANEEISVKSGRGFSDILKRNRVSAEALRKNAPGRVERALHHAAQPAAPGQGNGAKAGPPGAARAVNSHSAGVLTRIDRHELSLTHLDKVLYPKTGTTKAQVIDYYRQIAPVLLPHLRDHPVSFKRFPDGVEGEVFFQKRCPAGAPPWVKTVKVPSERSGTIDFCVLNDLDSLLWAANLAALELHTYLHHGDHLDRPTMLVLDLDPGPPADIHECARVALLARNELDRLKLKCFAKTSGGKGIHLCIPLNTNVTYAQTKQAAHTIATYLEQQHPEMVFSAMSRKLRGGKVFVDWSQNDTHKTTVCAYSLRGLAEPSVSLPLEWEEVEKIARAGKTSKLDMSPAGALARVEKKGDLLAPLLDLREALPST